MNTIDVEGLPAPVVQALQAMVQTLREEMKPQTEQERQKVVLRTHPGKVLGKLTREEIYEDVL